MMMGRMTAVKWFIMTIRFDQFGIALQMKHYGKEPQMNSENEFELPNHNEWQPRMGEMENDIPGDGEWSPHGIEDDILDDLDAQLEDDCMDGIWAV